MGYNDRGWTGYDRDGRDRDDRYGMRQEQGSRGDYGRGDRNRGFFERAGDEVRSWFGDEEAERRRRYDERYDDRYGSSSGRDQGYDRGGYGAGGYGGGYERQGSRYGGGGRDRFGNRDYGNGDYGARGGFGGRQGQSFGGLGYGGNTRRDASDSSYHSWRDRQMSELDRDYDDYRRENQSRFENEFASYRTRRQGQRGLLQQVQEHFEVIGSDGEHVGKVDHVRGDRIKLAKNDSASGGHHHFIPSSWIESVDGQQVKISKTAAEAKKAWREADDDRGDDRQRTDWSTDHNLDRSFSGTY